VQSAAKLPHESPKWDALRLSDLRTPYHPVMAAIPACQPWWAAWNEAYVAHATSASRSTSLHDTVQRNYGDKETSRLTCLNDLRTILSAQLSALHSLHVTPLFPFSLFRFSRFGCNANCTIVFLNGDRAPHPRQGCRGICLEAVENALAESQRGKRNYERAAVNKARPLVLRSK
jgi:hypothetical protein